ncbi:MAG: hypothetical protein J6D52_05150 [Clostridia bacterium]|nr:hypothetical protein [Clostridia bacterium]
MRKMIILLLCCGLILCSACNKAEHSYIENQSTVSETAVTEQVSGRPTEEEKETASTESTPPQSTTTVINEHPKEETTITTTSSNTSSTTETTIEEQVTEEIIIADSTEVERLVIKYINEYRTAQDDTEAITLIELTEVARYRAIQLITDFAHTDIREACAKLKYGRYFDMTEYGMDEKYNYYEGYDREAICKGEWFGTADMIAKNIAEGFKNSAKHWDYLGDSKYEYIAVGITYNEADKYWYGCVCMSSENYGG